MFKRYKNPFDKDSSSNTLLDSEKVYTEVNKGSPYSSNLVKNSQNSPPRIFETSSENSELEKKNEPFYSPLSLRQSLNGVIPSLNNNFPDTTLGEGVSFKGKLTFKGLLCIDGHFEGELVSDGRLVIGPTGTVKSNINMREAIIEGEVEGNITVQERLELRSKAKIYGNIEAQSLSVDDGVTIVGHINVRPHNEETNKSVEE